MDGDPDDITKWCARKEAAERGEHIADAGDVEMQEFAKEENAMMVILDDDNDSMMEHEA